MSCVLGLKVYPTTPGLWGAADGTQGSVSHLDSRHPGVSIHQKFLCCWPSMGEVRVQSLASKGRPKKFSCLNFHFSDGGVEGRNLVGGVRAKVWSQTDVCQ